MSEEIIFTLLISLCVAGGTWLAVAIMTKSKKRRIRRGVEQGLADYLARFDSRLGTRQ